MSIFMISPVEMSTQLAKQAQAKRLSLNLTQQTLAERSGVSYGVLKKFERTGKISLESLLKISLVLGVLENFKDVFQTENLEISQSLDELIKEKSRKRGRK